MVSPFNKHEVKVLADKTGNTIYSFTDSANPRVPPLPVRSSASFYNGYTDDSESRASTFSLHSRGSSSKPVTRTRSLSPVKQHSRHRDPTLQMRRSSEIPPPSPPSTIELYRTSSESEMFVSPRRISQTDCTDRNCLNLLHEHSRTKPPKLRPFSRTPSPQTPRSVTASSNSPRDGSAPNALPRDKSPRDMSRDPGIRRTSSLDKLCEALRNANIAMKQNTAPPDIISGYGLSLEFLSPDKTGRTGHTIAPLFSELGDEPVTIEKVQLAWEEKGLKNPHHPAIVNFLKNVDHMTKGDNAILPNLISQSLEEVLNPGGDYIKEAAVVAFKSVITNLQTDLASTEQEVSKVNLLLEAKAEELENLTHEADERASVEYKKFQEKIRQEKNLRAQSISQLEKEQTEKTEKLHHQIDTIIRQRDKDIKSLKQEQENLKRIIADQDTMLAMKEDAFKKARIDAEKYVQLEDDFKKLYNENLKLQQEIQQFEREKGVMGESFREWKERCEEFVSENKALRDDLDEIHFKFTACKVKLDKAEKAARSYKKKYEDAKERLSNNDDFLFQNDRKELMKKRISVMPGYTPIPQNTSKDDSDFEESLNDELIDTEANAALELEDTKFELEAVKSELDDCRFEIERYAKILLRLQNENETLKSNMQASDEASSENEDGEDEGVTGESEGVTGEGEGEVKDDITNLPVVEAETHLQLKTSFDEKSQQLLDLSQELEKLNEKYNAKEREVEQLKEVTVESDKVAEYLEQIEILHQTVARTTTEIANLEEELEETNKIISGYEDTISEKQTAFDECKEEFEECKRELETTQLLAGELEADLKAAYHQHDVDTLDFKSKVDRLENQVEELREQEAMNSERTKELAKLQDKSIVSNDLIKRLQAQVEELEVVLAETQNALADAESECSALKKQVEHGEMMREQLTARTEETEHLLGEVEKLQHSVSMAPTPDHVECLESQIKDLQLNVEELTKCLAVTQSEVDERAAEVEAKVKVLAETSTDLERTQNLLRNSEAELHDTRGKLDTTSEMLERTAAEHANTTAQLNQTNQALTEQTVELQEAVAKLEVLKTTADKEKGVQESLSDKLAAAENNLVSVTEEMNRSTARTAKEKDVLLQEIRHRDEEIDNLKVHLEQVEKDYEELVENLNKETDNRVTELQHQLEETAGLSGGLKSQLNDLGQQLIVLTAERDRYYKDCGKLKAEYDKLLGESDKFAKKVEELRGVKKTLENDIEQHIAEYQDMMRSCASLQTEKQELLDELESTASDLHTTKERLEQTEFEKEEIIQTFEEAIREKERALELSIAERSAMEGRYREKDAELRLKHEKENNLTNVKRSLEEQLAAAIRSLDDLTERYETENSILEEKVIESLNEVEEIKQHAEKELLNQQELMYKEFNDELTKIKEDHEKVIGDKKEETGKTISEFKRKCEVKVDNIKADFGEKLSARDATISELKNALTRAEDSRNSEIESLNNSYMEDRKQLLDTLTADKDKMLDRINDMADDRIRQLEDSHHKTCQSYEKKLQDALDHAAHLKADLQKTAEQYERECEELKAQVIEVTSQAREDKVLAESKMEQLHKDVKEKSAKVEDLQLRLMDKELEAQKNIQDFKSELEGQRRDFEAQLDKVRLDLRKEAEAVIRDHENQMDELKASHASEIGKLQQHQQSELRMLNNDHDREIEAMAKEHEAKTHALQEDFKTVIENLTSQQEEEVKNLEQVLGETKLHVDHLRSEVYDKDETIAALEAKYEDKIGMLEEELGQATNNVSALAKDNEEKENLVEDLLAKVGDIKKAHEAEKESHALARGTASQRIENLRNKVKALATALGSEQVVTMERARQVDDIAAERDKLQKEITEARQETERDREYFTAQLEAKERDNEESKEHLIKHHHREKVKIQAQLDQVINEHAQCYGLRRKIASLKQQLAAEKTARHPNAELEHQLAVERTHSASLKTQVKNLRTATTKLEATVSELWRENADLTANLNVAQNDAHLSLQEAIKTKSQKVAICNILDNVVNMVSTPA